MGDKYNQLCVISGVLLENGKELEDYFLKEFEVRVKYAETVITNGSIEKNEEGGRHDVLFFVHDDDVQKFAIPRFKAGIRWWEDVVKYNDNSYLYPQEILDKYPANW